MGNRDQRCIAVYRTIVCPPTRGKSAHLQHPWRGDYADDLHLVVPFTALNGPVRAD